MATKKFRIKSHIKIAVAIALAIIVIVLVFGGTSTAKFYEPKYKPERNVTAITFCKDADGGKNLNKAGNCTDLKGTYAETCSGNAVAELWCVNGWCATGVPINCKYGCSNGSCVVLATLAG